MPVCASIAPKNQTKRTSEIKDACTRETDDQMSDAKMEVMLCAHPKQSMLCRSHGTDDRTMPLPKSRTLPTRGHRGPSPLAIGNHKQDWKIQKLTALFRQPHQPGRKILSIPMSSAPPPNKESSQDILCRSSSWKMQAMHEAQSDRCGTSGPLQEVAPLVVGLALMAHGAHAAESVCSCINKKHVECTNAATMPGFLVDDSALNAIIFPGSWSGPC